jgi:signal transduction histidine kinase
MQVIINLLSNATKFSPTGGTVTIGMTPVGDQIRISVSDQGTGIPDAFKPHVFERFAQAGSTDRRQQGGSGLGLAIAKGLVERFAGAISFESSATSGTTFWVDLPAIR